uniref:Protein RIC1 homolog n=1 Tax=Petromyzon marinus TaxID=7757 RepID=A0AAJ7WT45_PETMA|nr:RAB6A-GEF complex partner protein 1 [Petromyzon marinus]
MYFAVGKPRRLLFPFASDESPHFVAADRERLLLAALSRSQLSVWFARPSVLVVSRRSSLKALAQLGAYERAAWKVDSSCIAVTTGRGYVLLFDVLLVGGEENSLYLAVDHRGSPVRRGVPGYKDEQRVPALSLELGRVLDIQASISCLISLPDDIIATTTDGKLHHLRWDGLTNGRKALDLCTVPFAVDLQSAAGAPLPPRPVSVRDMAFCQTLGGFAVVLTDGRAGFITAADSCTDQVLGVWAPDVADGSCVAANNKYRLLAFGCRSGCVLVYAMDTVAGALQLSHRLELTAKDYPDMCKRTGAVQNVRWSPDWTVLVLSWERGGLSAWSAFGAPLLCTLAADFGFHPDGSRKEPLKISSMSWGPEGYTLWVLTPPPDAGSDVSDGAGSKEDCGYQAELLILHFVKSALALHPCVSNQEQVLLQGDDRLYLSCGEPPTSRPHTPSPPFLLGHRHWHIVQIHNSYLDNNWPIRHAAMDAQGQCVAVSGRAGLAHYSLYTRKWKLFGNITQEQSMAVTGGLVWWQDFIVAACHNLAEGQDELRVYPRASNLDNAHAHVQRLPAPPLLLGGSRGRLLLFCSDRQLHVYSVERSPLDVPHPGVTLRALQRVSLQAHVPHPGLVVSVALTSMRSEKTLSSLRPAQQACAGDSVLLNVAGQLLMLQRDRSGPQPLDVSDDPTSSTSSSTSSAASLARKNPSFCAPVVLAECVEITWTTGHSAPRPQPQPQSTPHQPQQQQQQGPATEVLWLGCGRSGMKVWLPLSPAASDGGWPAGPLHGYNHNLNHGHRHHHHHQEQHHQQQQQHHAGSVFQHAFMSRRIMLPFPVPALYPLTVLAEHGLVLGVTTETLPGSSSGGGGGSVADLLPFCVAERASQLYLPAVLRGLLARNLGDAAVWLARGCSSLPYFRHALESALHAVLEEEAMARSPVPDPLLPALAKFAAAFPGFLRTVAHCARKSEVALWPCLFAAVGSPKQLFEECLVARDLETAASYLIILQNMEAPALSRQHATLLFNSALDEGRWDLCRNMIRFLRAIGTGGDDDGGAGAGGGGGGGAGGGGGGGGGGAAPATPPGSESSATSSSGFEFFRHRSISLSQPPDGAPFAAPAGSAAGGATAREGSASGGSAASGTRGGPLHKALSVPDGHVPKRAGAARAEASAVLPGAGCSPEDVFLDAMLARHARRLLEGARVRQLGRFAARLSFPLVAWLRKERHRAARPADPVSALRGLHRDFRRPLPPAPTATPVVPGAGMPTVADLRPSCHGTAVKPGHHAAPSGRTSSDAAAWLANPPSPIFLPTDDPAVTHDALLRATPSRPHGPTFTHEAVLHPLPKKGDECSLGSATDATESSSLGDAEWGLLDESGAESTSDPRLNGGGGGAPPEPTGRAAERAVTQLRYLLHVFAEAGCPEWCLLLALVLRDAGAVRAAVAAVARGGAPGVGEPGGGGPGGGGPCDAAARLAEVVASVERWAAQCCPGYRAFLSQLQPELQALSALADSWGGGTAAASGGGAAGFGLPASSMAASDACNAARSPYHEGPRASGGRAGNAAAAAAAATAAPAPAPSRPRDAGAASSAPAPIAPAWSGGGDGGERDATAAASPVSPCSPSSPMVSLSSSSSFAASSSPSSFPPEGAEDPAGVVAGASAETAEAGTEDGPAKGAEAEEYACRIA